MHGDDLNGALVALQADHRLVADQAGSRGGVAAHALQPGDQAERPESALPPCPLQQLRQMQEVRQLPLAARQREHTAMRAPILEEAPEQPDRTVPQPALAPLAQPLQPGIPILSRFVEAVQLVAADSDQAGGERPAQGDEVGRLGHGAQHALELLRLLAVEDALVHAQHAVDPEAAERVPDLPGLEAIATQHRDVAGAQASIADLGSRGEQLADVGGDGPGISSPARFEGMDRSPSSRAQKRIRSGASPARSPSTRSWAPGAGSTGWKGISS